MPRLDPFVLCFINEGLRDFSSGLFVRFLGYRPAAANAVTAIRDVGSSLNPEPD
jgi:hypothetical protein